MKKIDCKTVNRKTKKGDLLWVVESANNNRTAIYLRLKNGWVILTDRNHWTYDSSDEDWNPSCDYFLLNKE